MTRKEFEIIKNNLSNSSIILHLHNGHYIDCDIDDIDMDEKHDILTILKRRENKSENTIIHNQYHIPLSIIDYVNEIYILPKEDFEE